MSVLVKEVKLIGTKGAVRCRALFDSGASYSIIRRDIAERISTLTPLPNPDEWVFETARPGQLIEAQFVVVLDFRFDDSQAKFHSEFVVFDSCSEELIIGANTLQGWHIKLDFETETVIYRKTAERLRVI